MVDLVFVDLKINRILSSRPKHKPMKKSTLLLLICFAGFHVFGQGLTITSGNKVKNFKPGSWYEIVVKGDYKGAQPCDQLLYQGVISRTSNDSLTLRLGSITVRSIVESKKIEHEVLFADQAALTSFAAEDILNLKHYKSEKAQKRKNGFVIAGGILIFTGAATLLNALFVHDDVGRQNILISGGIQVGLGITFASMSGTKRYYFRDKEEVWKVVTTR